MCTGGQRNRAHWSALEENEQSQRGSGRVADRDFWTVKTQVRFAAADETSAVGSASRQAVAIPVGRVTATEKSESSGTGSGDP